MTNTPALVSNFALNVGGAFSFSAAGFRNRAALFKSGFVSACSAACAAATAGIIAIATAATLIVSNILVVFVLFVVERHVMIISSDIECAFSRHHRVAADAHAVDLAAVQADRDVDVAR